MNMNKEIIEKIRNRAAAFAPAQLELLQNFASFDSETHCIEGNRRVIGLVKEHLAPLDAQIEEITIENVGTHLIARIRPEGAKGRILMNSHLDTVFPVGYAGQNPPHIEGDWLYGLGVIDCKGGFAVSCYAVRIAKELGILPNVEIDMIYSCDEEQGSVTGQEIYRREAKGADAVFVFEPGELTGSGKNAVITSRQGVILGSLDITGVEAHAGNAYSKGHSANRELAHKILELYALNDEEKGIFYNAAPVSGGRPNGVVSGSANMQFCVAGIPDRESYRECEKKLDALGAHTNDPYCTAKMTYRMLFPPQEHLEASTRIFRQVEKAAQALGMEVEETGVNPCGEDIYAAGDANYFAEADIPALDGFGPVGSGMHTTEERVYIPSIREKTELFAAYLYLMSLEEQGEK